MEATLSYEIKDKSLFVLRSLGLARHKRRLYLELLATIGQQLFEDFSTSKNWEVFPDVVPALRRIKQTGLILGAISNFDDRLCGILKSLGIIEYFDFVLSSFEVSCAKPDARIFQLAASRAFVNPSQAIHVGDDYHLDYLAARRAAMRSLLLVRKNEEWPKLDKGCLEEPVLISSLAEVLQHL